MFLNEDFLLTSEFSKKLYHEHASKMPIIDYHCHLDPKEIYENASFRNLTHVWLDGDHYKWRLMRANGIDEFYITGDADDYSKFKMWAKTVPLSIGNPIYAWTHLELKRFFKIDLLLNEENAETIWNEANKIIASGEFKPQDLIRSFDVKVICTTDDPIDSLEYHQLMHEQELGFKVLPTFRPDKALNIDKDTFLPWLQKLSNSVNYDINSYQNLLSALQSRVDYFDTIGCRLADHGIDNLRYSKASEEEIEVIFDKALNGLVLSNDEISQYYGNTLLALFGMYHDKKWTSQLHLKAYRNVNSKMFNKLGADTGYDGINDVNLVSQLHSILDNANSNDCLPKTIIYSLNPGDYQSIVTLMGGFQGGEVMKIQMGSGWWFNDTRTGMRDQLTCLANGSLLGHFVGMLTDSRSFLSYPRHEYFRRVLCELIGEWQVRGEIPDNLEMIGKIIEDISYNNASKYFGF